MESKSRFPNPASNKGVKTTNLTMYVIYVDFGPMISKDILSKIIM